MSIKNKLKILGILLVFTLMMSLVFAGSGGVENKKSNPCEYDESQPWNYDPIGCLCVTDRGSVSEDIIYAKDYFDIPMITAPTNIRCWDPNLDGMGVTKECDTQNLEDQGMIPDEDGDINCHHPVTYCQSDNKCHDCFPDETKKENELYKGCELDVEDLPSGFDIHENLIKNHCLKGKYFQPRYKCYNCIRTEGTGEKVITFVFGNLPDDKTVGEAAQEYTNYVITKEPFKYLHEQKNVFQFQYVDVPIPNQKVFLTETHIGRAYDRWNEIASYGREICTNTDTIVYVDYSWWSAMRTHELVIVGDNYGYSQGGLLHELGHELAELADEYRAQSAGSELRQINLDLHPCNNFDSYGIPEENCYPLQNKGKLINNQRISRPGSIMGYGHDFFNIIQCAVLLKELDNIGINQGVDYCSGEINPYGYDIGSGILDQYNGFCHFVSFRLDLEKNPENPEEYEACVNSGYDAENCFYNFFAQERNCEPREANPRRLGYGGELIGYTKELCYSNDLDYCPNGCSEGSCL